MNRTDRIKSILQQLDPIELFVENRSAAHHGHAGDDGSGETHYHVVLTSRQLVGLSRVEQQRKIYQALAPEFQTGLHALTLDLQQAVDKL
jgi:BolA family transcriptional regulator, general stress-responsive regulator